MRTVLVVEQAERPRAATELGAEGFGVVTAVHVHEALDVHETVRADLVIVEGPASLASVRRVCASLRPAVTAPLALLSAPCSEIDAVAAFATGVDNLILEPVGHHELLARARSLLRRVPRTEWSKPEVLAVGPVELDCARREVFVRGEQVRLPRREFDIAFLLMRDAGRVVSRKTLVQELWGSLPDTKSLDVQVGRLRARLAAAEGRRRIVTVRGVGYRFLTDDEDDDTTTASGTIIDLAPHVSDVQSGEVRAASEILEGSASA